MNANRKLSRLTACAVLVAGLAASATPSHAYRMIQNTSTGRVTGGSLVTCSNASGFTHWDGRDIDWYHNTSGVGSGKATALQNAMAAWNNVSSADHILYYAGTTGAGFSTDSQNTVVWASNGSCGAFNGCLALTALVLQSGQVIVESDVVFSTDWTWTTNGAQYDTQTVATHEFGHTLGIHHTELTGTPRPTMYPSYFGTDGQTLESDDIQALQCAESQYPAPPVYDGVHDTANCTSIAGTAYDTRRKNRSINVNIRDGATLLATVPTNSSTRRFSYSTPASVKDGQWHTINVQYSGNGANLPGTGLNVICGVSGLPGTPAEVLDTGGLPWSVGNQFNSSVAGKITQLRYYRSTGENGLHTAKLWTSGGSLLASATVDFGSSGSGWVYFNITDTAISANTNYWVTVTTYTKQSKTSCGFSTPITSGPLTFHGGAYLQADGSFPTNGSCSNFWTDVVFDM